MDQVMQVFPQRLHPRVGHVRMGQCAVQRHLVSRRADAEHLRGMD